MMTATWDSAGGPARGATALGALEGGDVEARRRYRLGDLLRAARVFAGTAAEVILLGRVDEARAPQGAGPRR